MKVKTKAVIVSDLTEENIKVENSGETVKQSLADMIKGQDEAAKAPSLPFYVWIKIIVLGALVLLFFRDEVIQLWKTWRGNVNWSHGFIIPFFSCYLIYAWWDKITKIPCRIWLPGIFVILLAMVGKAYGLIVLHNMWSAQLMLPLMIWGLVLYLCGPRMAMVLFVPIFFLELAMPLPDRLYNLMSLPMQNLSARMATSILQLFGVQISVSASYMQVVSISGVHHSLEVAEACSGMRSLMAFIALGVAMAYLDERPFWERLVIMLAGIPIALICNILRVTLTCSMFVLDMKELGEGFMHNMMGMALLVPALILLFLLAKLLDGLYVEEDDDVSDASGGDDAAEVKS
ncbi:MAG TPA: exosortase/archaeosortase family protein [Phycisphaerae bacterium]|nr:exosortase/archaeosortase family protein [Phycisphaerae bacterium]HPS51970.1 exosortase/archaeosortase family protein [Phycisphaerae bacterium]